MHTILAIVVLVLAAYWVVPDVTDWNGMEMPAAIKHDVPVLLEAAKKHLPSQEKVQSVAENDVLPRIKAAADQLKSNIDKEIKKP